MPQVDENLLARLAGRNTGGGDDPWASVAAKKPAHEPAGEDPKLDNLLKRIQGLSGVKEAPAISLDHSEGGTTAMPLDNFVPVEPRSFREAELTDSEVEALVLKYLLARGDATGRSIADQMNLPFILVDELLRTLKQEQLLVYKG